MLFTREQQLKLISAVANAPSVHNVQPARFHFTGDNIYLLEDLTRRIPCGDPMGRDTGFSLGIAAEGLRIELANQGYSLVDKGEFDSDIGFGNNIKTRRAFEITKGAEKHPLAEFVTKRYSQRGNFNKVLPRDTAAAKSLSDDNIISVTEKEDLKEIGKIYDAASLRFFRDDNFREELLSWMRLSKKHPKWSIDGLNYDAMAMSEFEAKAAGIVLSKKIFPLINKIGLGGAITAEAGKVIGSAGVILLHRPKTESHYESGRHFYLTWLKIVANGFQAAVMASLADDIECQNLLCNKYNIGNERRIITTFRIGRSDNMASRARLKPEDLLL